MLLRNMSSSLPPSLRALQTLEAPGANKRGPQHHELQPTTTDRKAYLPLAARRRYKWSLAAVSGRTMQLTVVTVALAPGPLTGGMFAFR